MFRKCYGFFLVLFNRLIRPVSWKVSVELTSSVLINQALIVWNDALVWLRHIRNMRIAVGINGASSLLCFHYHCKGFVNFNMCRAWRSHWLKFDLWESEREYEKCDVFSSERSFNDCFQRDSAWVICYL